MTMANKSSVTLSHVAPNLTTLTILLFTCTRAGYLAMNCLCNFALKHGKVVVNLVLVMYLYSFGFVSLIMTDEVPTLISATL